MDPQILVKGGWKLKRTLTTNTLVRRLVAIADQPGVEGRYLNQIIKRVKGGFELWSAGRVVLTTFNLAFAVSMADTMSNEDSTWELLVHPVIGQLPLD